MIQLSSTNLTVELLRPARWLEGMEENSTLRRTDGNLVRRRADFTEAHPFIAIFVVFHIMHESRTHRETRATFGKSQLK